MREFDSLDKTILTGALVAMIGNLFLGAEMMTLPNGRCDLSFAVAALWGIVVWLMVRKKPSQPWGVQTGTFFGALSFLSFPVFWSVFRPWLLPMPSDHGILVALGTLFGREGLIHWTAMSVTFGALGFFMSTAYMFVDDRDRARS